MISLLGGELKRGLVWYIEGGLVERGLKLEGEKGWKGRGVGSEF